MKLLARVLAVGFALVATVLWWPHPFEGRFLVMHDRMVSSATALVLELVIIQLWLVAIVLVWLAVRPGRSRREPHPRSRLRNR